MIIITIITINCDARLGIIEGNVMKDLESSKEM